MAKNDEYDFGFTFSDEEEVVSSSEVLSSKDAIIEDLEKRLQSVEKMILPLLKNLAMNPEKPMIKWPNRKEVIDKQIQKLLELTKT